MAPPSKSEGNFWRLDLSGYHDCYESKAASFIVELLFCRRRPMLPPPLNDEMPIFIYLLFCGVRRSARVATSAL